MDSSSLSGAQRAQLRGLGQRLDAMLKLGREGVTTPVARELDQLLRAHELVKIRFVNADREQRAALCERVSAELHCECVGAVGHTALFFRRNADAADRRIEFSS